MIFQKTVTFERFKLMMYIKVKFKTDPSLSLPTLYCFWGVCVLKKRNRFGKVIQSAVFVAVTFRTHEVQLCDLLYLSLHLSQPPIKLLAHTPAPSAAVREHKNYYCLLIRLVVEREQQRSLCEDGRCNVTHFPRLFRGRQNVTAIVFNYEIVSLVRFVPKNLSAVSLLWPRLTSEEKIERNSNSCVCSAGKKCYFMLRWR